MNEVKNFVRLVLWGIIQVLVLNQINFLGFASPFLVLLFFMIYPNHKSKWELFLIAFFTGLCIDAFSDTGGIYAASLLLVVLFRPVFLRLFFIQKADEHEVNLFQILFFPRVLYVFLIAFVFHASFYLFEYFSFAHWVANFAKVLICSVLTMVVCLLGLHFSISSKK